MKSVLNLESPLVPPPRGYHGNFFMDVQRALIGVGMISYDDRYGTSLEKGGNFKLHNNYVELFGFVFR